MGVTSTEVEAAHALVERLAERCEADGTEYGPSQAAVRLRNALYDLWGAFGYLAIDEGLVER